MSFTPISCSIAKIPRFSYRLGIREDKLKNMPSRINVHSHRKRVFIIIMILKIQEILSVQRDSSRYFIPPSYSS